MDVRGALLGVLGLRFRLYRVEGLLGVLGLGFSVLRVRMS